MNANNELLTPKRIMQAMQVTREIGYRNGREGVSNPELAFLRHFDNPYIVEALRIIYENGNRDGREYVQ